VVRQSTNLSVDGTGSQSRVDPAEPRSAGFWRTVIQGVREQLGHTSDYEEGPKVGEAEASAAAAEYARTNALRPTPPAFKYQMTAPAKVMMRWRGTFWPLVIKRYELYLYVGVHVFLVAYAAVWREDPDRSAGEVLWGTEAWMIPWTTLGISLPLMSFFLVFFIGQCYTRFCQHFTTVIAIETSVHESAMACLTHMVDDVDAPWDVVRYLTASALIIYFRTFKLADFKEAMVDVSEFDRMLNDEREWLKVDEADWEKIMGWPRSREEAKSYTAELQHILGLSNEQPSRLATCPPLLTTSEVDLLRQYPGGMMSMVLQTWALQRAKKTGKLPGPLFNGLQASVFKLRAAAYRVRQQLAMPIPLPYFHSLNWLLNINYGFYTYALLYHESNLTPIVLFVFILITCGMREVAAALSNPFGDDDVDFPVHKYISQLRGVALCVHKSNVPIRRPRASSSPPS